ncbi:uncharacterized protein LOC143242718 isoform X3 [Tachypleus tridentatus]|uniref:uncharacterized protein LOC143242718 isoform X3 n=1 Tax=Tachypleus tridentatus TaxID=6853 RepID=UPI003FD3098D
MTVSDKPTKFPMISGLDWIVIRCKIPIKPKVFIFATVTTNHGVRFIQDTMNDTEQNKRRHHNHGLWLCPSRNFLSDTKRGFGLNYVQNSRSSRSKNSWSGIDQNGHDSVFYGKQYFQYSTVQHYNNQNLPSWANQSPHLRSFNPFKYHSNYSLTSETNGNLEPTVYHEFWYHKYHVSRVLKEKNCFQLHSDYDSKIFTHQRYQHIIENPFQNLRSYELPVFTRNSSHFSNNHGLKCRVKHESASFKDQFFKVNNQSRELPTGQRVRQVHNRKFQYFPTRCNRMLNLCSNSWLGVQRKSRDHCSFCTPCVIPRVRLRETSTCEVVKYEKPKTPKVTRCCENNIQQTFRSRLSQRNSDSIPLPVDEENPELVGINFVRCQRLNKTVLSTSEDSNTKRHTIQVSSSPNLRLSRLSSDSSYEKTSSHSQVSSPNSPLFGPQSAQTPSPTSRRFSSFFSKHTPKIPLKRTKSTTKLERKQGTTDGGRLHTSKSHESLLITSPEVFSNIDLNQYGVNVKPLSQHYCGQEHCFELYSTKGVIRHYSCSSEEERDSWVQRLRDSMYKQTSNKQRMENSLVIWILEAKGLLVKKRYYCELYLGEDLYSRTSSKQMDGMCFWGEHFEFNHLSEIETVSVKLYRESDTKRKRHKLIGSLEIPTKLISGKQLIENRYKIRLEKNSGMKESPFVRIKARFQSVNILPLERYKDFRQFLCSKNKSLVQMLEPVQVIVKEDIAVTLVRIMQKEHGAKEFLTNIVIEDVKKVDDQHLTFRGNSFATKASEAYMKLLGNEYLQNTLRDFVKSVLEFEDDCEVDPSKVPNENILQKQQKNLLRFVEEAWNKITSSAPNLPFELQEVFCEYRKQLQAIGKEHICDKLINASIFLRFLCPSILSPSLFNLTKEYPEPKSARNLTLIAKTIQTLANFTRFGEKEHFMIFLNQFVDKQQYTMKNFLQQISTPGEVRKLNFSEQIDLGKELSILHSQLIDCIPKMNKTNYEDFEELKRILNDISSSMSQPSITRQKSFQNLSNIIPNTHNPLGPTKSLPERSGQAQHQSLINSPVPSSNSSRNKTSKLSGGLQHLQETTSSPSLLMEQPITTTRDYSCRGNTVQDEYWNVSDDYVNTETLHNDRNYIGGEDSDNLPMHTTYMIDKHSSSLLQNGDVSKYSLINSLCKTQVSENKVKEETHRNLNSVVSCRRGLQLCGLLETLGRPKQIVLARNILNSDFDNATCENYYCTKPGNQFSVYKTQITISSGGQCNLPLPLAFKNPLYFLDDSCRSSSESDFLEGLERESSHFSYFDVRDNALSNSNGSVYHQNEADCFSLLSCTTSLSDNETMMFQTHSPLTSLTHSIKPGFPPKVSISQYKLPHSNGLSSHMAQCRLERKGSSDPLLHGQRKKGVQGLNHSYYFDTKRQKELRKVSP